MKTFLKELKWLWTISVFGLFVAFFGYIGWNVARTLIPFVLIAVDKWR